MHKTMLIDKEWWCAYCRRNFTLKKTLGARSCHYHDGKLNSNRIYTCCGDVAGSRGCLSRDHFPEFNTFDVAIIPESEASKFEPYKSWASRGFYYHKDPSFKEYFVVMFEPPDVEKKFKLEDQLEKYEMPPILRTEGKYQSFYAKQLCDKYGYWVIPNCDQFCFLRVE